jgi:hypothetical protein
MGKRIERRHEKRRVFSFFTQGMGRGLLLSPGGIM